MKNSESTHLVFRDYNCAQTIFSLFAPDLGLDKPAALKIASGFGSGMNQGDICGAVTGAYMVIGLKSGHTTSDPETKTRTAGLIRKFNDLFLQEHSCLRCSELLGYDISDQRQKEIARESGAFTTKCPAYLKSAAKILEDHF
jgi:C_GCAxxG_C_C family probable redox protein